MRKQIGDGFVWTFTDKLWKGDKNTSAVITDRAIICVNENNERIFPQSSKIPYLWMPTNDPGHELSIEHLNAIESFARNFMDWKEGLIVHCFGGRNRSSAICWFLMRRMFDMSTDEIHKIFQDNNSNVGIRKELADKILLLTGYGYKKEWICN